MSEEEKTTVTAQLHQAAPSIPIVDVWPLPRLTPLVQQAYISLANRGEIHFIHATASRSAQIAVVEYLSTVPADWTHEALRREWAELAEASAQQISMQEE